MNNTKKQLFIVLILLWSFMTLPACSSANNNQELPDKSKYTLQEFINERVNTYTRQSFRFVENVEMNDHYDVTIALVPEIASSPDKEAIYRSLAVYAYNVSSFYPEIKSYDFSILWDEKNKEEAIHASIDETGVANLANNYFAIRIDENANLKSSYQIIFTEIVESDIVKNWK